MHNKKNLFCVDGKNRLVLLQRGAFRWALQQARKKRAAPVHEQQLHYGILPGVGFGNNAADVDGIHYAHA